MKTLYFALPLMLLTACRVEDTGPTQRESKVFELDKSEIVRAEFRMGVGELKISGGSSKLAEADFEYNVPSWKPTATYTTTGFRGHLLIEQPKDSHGSSGGNVKNAWTVRVNDKVPIDFDFKFGVGEANLNLGSVMVRSLEMNMGVGEVKVDLRGDPKKDFNVNIRGGVGEATVYLPKNVAIVANASGGIGGIHTTGLTEENGRYVNKLYKEHAPVTVRIDIKGGIGAINLHAE